MPPDPLENNEVKYYLQTYPHFHFKYCIISIL